MGELLNRITHSLPFYFSIPLILLFPAAVLLLIAGIHQYCSSKERTIKKAGALLGWACFAYIVFFVILGTSLPSRNRLGSSTSTQSESSIASTHSPDTVVSVATATPKPTSTPTKTPTNTPRPTKTPSPIVVPKTPTSTKTDYILNRNTKKFHHPWCSSVDQMKESNKIYFTGTREEAIDKGYVPCKRCKP